MIDSMTEPAVTEPVRYMERTRDYYRAQGFERPYVWSRYQDCPFTPLAKPLARSRATLIVTANELAPDGWQAGERRPPRRVYSVDTDSPPEAFYTDDLSWHKEATHTRDLATYFPLVHLEALVAEGALGTLARRCHGVPTEYSHRRTLEQDAPEIVRRCREDGVDLAILVPL